MANIQIYLSWVQIVLSVALTVLVLVQMRNAGLGGVFGGTDSGVQHTRRGIDALLFNVTIVTAVLFGLISLANVVFTTPLAGG